HNEPLPDGLECCAGMDKVLTQLKEEGRRLGVVTAKRHRTVALAFGKLPLRELFDVLVCGDDTKLHKPDPDPILLALERLGADASDTAYVVDAPFDVSDAKAARVFAIAVTWGGINPRETLEAEAPDAVIS